TGFAGWQRQTGRRTVEGELRRALRELCGSEVHVTAAGRTDAGAHALGQVVNFRLDRIPVGRLAGALNSLLPEDVSALSAEFVDLELVAEGFLRGLARGIAGALAEVGLGRRPPQWVGEVLALRDRRAAAKTAPARGLTLMEVIYE